MSGLDDVGDDIGFGSIHLHQFDDIPQKSGGLVAFKFHLVWYLLASNCVIVMDLTWRQHPFHREDLPFLYHLADVALQFVDVVVLFPLALEQLTWTS